jgi:hypothetical protein
MDEREAAIRAAADHVERTRRRLQEGRAEIDRQHAEVAQTRDHIGGMRRWLEETFGRVPSDEGAR